MTKPDVSPAGRYSIGDTSRHLGITRKTLGRWTELGYIRRSYYKTGMRPFYTGLEILKCWNRIA